MQKLESASSITKARNNLDVPMYGTSQVGQLSQNMSLENNRRPGMPPSHPNNPLSLPYSQSQIMASRSNANLGASHYRSLSQSSGFDCLRPLNPSNPLTYRESSASDTVSNNVCMEERVGNSHGLLIHSPVNRVDAVENFPPRKGHRRSSSDFPLGFSAMIQSSPQLIPIGSRGITEVEQPIQLVKRESEWNASNGSNHAEGISEKKPELVDDLFSEYMNLENIDTLNSSGTEDKDLDGRASGTKTNGGESSDNEVESHANENLISLQGTSSSEKREGIKRRATGDIAPTVRHHRSLSMDSYTGNFHFDDESTKLPFGTQLFPGSSTNGNMAKIRSNGEFSEVELKKILTNDKLAEIALSDPKRAKRILANRQSAARSKERKMRYIAELEQKVQTLQTEATTLSTQVTMLQKDSAGLTSQNNELKFRLQAMEQQAQLKDALNESLAAEVQRLKLAAAEVSGETHLSRLMAQQLSISQMFQGQPNQVNVYELQQQPLLNQLQSERQNGEAAIRDPK